MVALPAEVTFRVVGRGAANADLSREGGGRDEDVWKLDDEKDNDGNDGRDMEAERCGGTSPLVQATAANDGPRLRRASRRAVDARCVVVDWEGIIG